jgi:hypothetical protein
MTADSPKVGQWLFASCSAEDYGQILALGTDANGADVMDIRICNPQDLLRFEHSPDEHNGWVAPLTLLDLPEGTPVILRAVQWERSGDCVVCNTPSNGCFRCTKLFWLRDAPTTGLPP